MRKRRLVSDASWLVCAALAPLTGCSFAEAAADGVFRVVSDTVARVFADILGPVIGG